MKSLEKQRCCIEGRFPKKISWEHKGIPRRGFKRLKVQEEEASPSSGWKLWLEVADRRGEGVLKTLRKASH